MLSKEFHPPPGSKVMTSFHARSEIWSLCRAMGLHAPVWTMTFPARDEIAGGMGWGRKATSLRVRSYAHRRALPFWSVEDGFLRSVGLGKHGAPSLSFLIDDLGVYYDASTPSRLETMILAGSASDEQRSRARALMARIAALDLTKYNTGSTTPMPTASRRRVLVVDQVAGDLSIAGALAGADAFTTMVQTALRENPDAEITVKVHPDVLAGLARGALALSKDAPVTLLARDMTPGALLQNVDRVYTVSSQLGFEALIRGVPVITFGVPFYAGWGLTDDRAAGGAAAGVLARRRAAGTRSLDDLIHASLIEYPVYVDPTTQTRSTPEETIDRLDVWRREATLFGDRRTAIAFSNWKRPHAETYLRAAGGKTRFAAIWSLQLHLIGAAKTFIGWGSRLSPEQETWIRARSHRFLRMEDGFIRSIGLGSNFNFPWSLCVDDEGIYYDSTRSSRLEALLRKGPLTAEQAERAARLRKRLVALGITKYNLAGEAPQDLRAVSGERKVALVLGQVPDDQSIRLGQSLPESNLDLLSRVRAENPDAYIVYKEHPELVAGNREGLTAPEALGRLADQVLMSGDTARWIEAVDEIHIRTSLAGFEGLLRGKPVVCWGLPFYAGWGLTQDRVRCERRNIQLSLDDLVYRTLFDYASYRLPGCVVPARPETILEKLDEQLRHKGTAQVSLDWRQRLRRSFDYVAGMVMGGFDPRPRR